MLGGGAEGTAGERERDYFLQVYGCWWCQQGPLCPRMSDLSFGENCETGWELKESEAAGIRTLDLRIKSPLLYQLSYSL